MSDKPLKWSELPEAERKRLHRNEVSNRTRARKKELPVVPVCVEALWMLQNGCCACPKCNYQAPLEVGDTVIAHKEYLGGVGSPGHTPGNVQLWIKSHNAEVGHQETSDKAKYDRFRVDLLAKPAPVDEDEIEQAPKRKSSWGKGRGVSKLSKDHPGYRKPTWGKRKAS